MKHSHARVERPLDSSRSSRRTRDCSSAQAERNANPRGSPLSAAASNKRTASSGSDSVRTGRPIGCAREDRERLHLLLAAGLEEGDQFLIGFLAIESGGLFPLLAARSTAFPPGAIHHIPQLKPLGALAICALGSLPTQENTYSGSRDRLRGAGCVQAHCKTHPRFLRVVGGGAMNNRGVMERHFTGLKHCVHNLKSLQKPPFGILQLHIVPVEGSGRNQRDDCLPRSEHSQKQRCCVSIHAVRTSSQSESGGHPNAIESGTDFLFEGPGSIGPSHSGWKFTEYVDAPEEDGLPRWADGKKRRSRTTGISN